MQSSNICDCKVKKERKVSGFNLMSCVSQMPLSEQEGPSLGSLANFELMSSKDVAYHMTFYDWELFHCVHEVFIEQ